MRVYIGHDSKEARSFKLAMASAQSFGCRAEGIYDDRLRTNGMLSRPMDTRGQLWDIHSGAPQSTRFAIARFFTPLLAHSGWCLFTDCDVVFLRDPKLLTRYMDQRYAVMVVKHVLGQVGGTKMDGQVQTNYPRKLWSSVILFNCDHPGNRRINLQMLNSWPGRDLHAFNWLADDEIGSLPGEWNWLVGLQDKPDDPAIAHYTLGTPELVPDCDYADIWHDAARKHLGKY